MQLDRLLAGQLAEDLKPAEQVKAELLQRGFRSLQTLPFR